MKILFSQQFQKRFERLSKMVQDRFEKRLGLFMEHPFHPTLKNHPLQGYLAGYRAFSVTGDYRVIYRMLDRETAKLIDIGTHSQVYE